MDSSLARTAQRVARLQALAGEWTAAVLDHVTQGALSGLVATAAVRTRVLPGSVVPAEVYALTMR